MPSNVKFKLLITVILPLFCICSCESDIVEPIQIDQDKATGLMKVRSIKEFPVLENDLSKIASINLAKSSSIADDSKFQLFDDFEVSTISIGDITTYTLPVIQASTGNDNLSNLVISYRNDTLIKSHIIRYEGSFTFNSSRDRHSGIVFNGKIKIEKIDNTDVNLGFIKSSTCYPIDILICSWVDPIEGGGDHFVGPNCTPEFISSEQFTFCPDGNNESDVSLINGPDTGSGGTAYGDGTITHPEWLITGTGDGDHDSFTAPVPNPSCEEDPLSLNGPGGCIGDIMVLNPEPIYTFDNFPGKDQGYPFEWWEDEVWISENMKLPTDDGLNEQTPNARELALFIAFPDQAIAHYNNSNLALAKARELAASGTLLGIEDGKADAFRHSYWNALGTKDFGSWIMKEFADAHEWDEDQSNLSVQMDYFNNQVGRDIGNANLTSSDSNLATTVLTKIIFGDMKYINANGIMVYTNE